MANFDVAKAIFAQVDANHDGTIDQNEFRNWVTTNTNSNTNSGIIASTSTFESATNGTSTQEGLAGLETSLQSNFGSNTSIDTSYVVLSNDSNKGASAPIQTSNAQQTNEYLAQSGGTIFNDPNPQVVRRAATTGPVTYQQKISVRFLQPPPVPPPGPLIIKEVRPPQPPPPPPLVVRQQAPPLPAPPPLVLRERPPVPPEVIASQTVIRRLPAVPVPPRSVIIERLPPLPPKPRDIIIERWVPYGPQPKRRTIVQRAPPAVQYPQPRNIIVVYDNVQARVIRQFQRLGITQENPDAYVTRFKDTLLDAATLVQQARAAGVIEDISPPASSFTNSNITNTNLFNIDAEHTLSSSSSSNIAADSAFSNSIGVTSTGFDPIAVSFTAADINSDGQLDQAEFRKFLEGGVH